VHILLDLYISISFREGSVVNGVVFFILLSTYSSVVYLNTIDFSYIGLITCTLLSSLSFLVLRVFL
jgi:hypothetical protein